MATESPERTSLAANVRGLWSDGRGPILVSIALGWFLVYGLRAAVPAILPQIKTAFVLDNAAAGLAYSALWSGYAIMQFPAGLLVDRFGERTLLVASLGLTALAVAGLALSPLFAAFVLGSLLLGLGMGLYGPARGTILSAVYDKSDGTAIGVTFAAGSIGGALIPFLAGVLVVSIGWRTTLGLLVPLFALIALFVWRVVPRARSAAVGNDGRSVAKDMDGIVEGVLKRPVLIAVVAITLLLSSFQGFAAFFPTYLTEVKGLNQGTAAGLYGLIFLAGAVAQPLAGGLADTYSDRAVLAVAAAIGALPLFVVPFVSGVVPFAILSAVVGVRLGTYPVTNAYIIRLLPDEVQGASWGLVRTVFFLVGAAGPALVGLLSDFSGFETTFLVLGGVTVVSAIVYALLPVPGTYGT
ncbi:MULTISPECIES: MFS transporter [unclassified Haladaptatus]|uniref:MFS transporter n=1 Tax=unclassified Haladaptatus TaxID=2622732 RepID=UPI0023E80576|nr:MULTISPECIES: MFS transporter [unclassified Haladaptatus]